MAYSGTFMPTNPEKYKGDVSKIVWRSLWELSFMRMCDRRTDVIEWSSEEFIIRYRSPADNRLHRYFPDFFIKVKQKDASVKDIMIEIKPFGQTIPPSPDNAKTKTGRPSTRYRNQLKTYLINQAKWEAARAVCESKGWDFLVLTEKELGLKR